MRKTFLNLGIFALLSTSVGAQVKNISFAAAPTGDYVWWQKKTAITNDFMTDGYIGFGFGRNIELLGSYRQAMGMKSTLTGYDVPTAISNAFETRDVAAHKWGGELKGNIPLTYSFQPYVTLGSGVQTIKTNDLSQGQIYSGLGLGAKFNLTCRLTLNVRAKVTRFSFDLSNMLYKPTEANTSAYNTWIDNNVEEENHLAWNVGAGLRLCLGGRNPSQLTALSRAYANLESFKVVIEPTLGYLNSNNNNNLCDAYFGGLALEVDFTECVGIRGHYHRAMTDERLSASFEGLSVYGGDFLARLNVISGVVPYVQIDAGYMEVDGNHVGKVAGVANKSGTFAKEGVGLAIPLGKRVEFFDITNLLCTTHNEDVTTALSSVNKLKNSVFYDAGLHIELTKSVEKELYGQQLGTAEVTTVSVSVTTTPITTTNAAPTVSPERRNLAYYNSQMTAIKKQIQLAYRSGNAVNASRLLKERQQREDLRSTYVAGHLPYPVAEQVHLVRMTPGELQQLIDSIVKNIREGEGKALEQHIDRSEKLFLRIQATREEVQKAKDELQKTTDEVQRAKDELQKTTDEIQKTKIGTPAAK